MTKKKLRELLLELDPAVPVEQPELLVNSSGKVIMEFPGNIIPMRLSELVKRTSWKEAEANSEVIRITAILTKWFTNQ